MNEFSSADWFAALTVALPLFAVGVASPGPATLAIMNTSMRSGRGQGLALGLGICFGSLFWGLLAAWGLAAVLALQVKLLIALKVSGALYFLWLASKLLRSAWRAAPLQAKNTQTYSHFAGQYLSGLMLHLLNPKAMFVWMAVIAIGLSQMQNPNPYTASGVTLVCWFFSVVVFMGYALVFSTDKAIAIYRALARWIDGVCGVVFILAGVAILLTV